MAKARHKKTTEYQTSMTRSVFMYGHPNKGKLNLLKEMQRRYTDLVNHYIEVLTNHEELTMQIVKNDKKDSAVRKLEKAERPMKINSAFSQNSFDCAFTKLSNRFDDIRLDMYAEDQTVFTQSKVLFAMSVMH